MGLEARRRSAASCASPLNERRRIFTPTPQAPVLDAGLPASPCAGAGSTADWTTTSGSSGTFARPPPGEGHGLRSAGDGDESLWHQGRGLVMNALRCGSRRGCACRRPRRHDPTPVSAWRTAAVRPRSRRGRPRRSPGAGWTSRPAPGGRSSGLFQAPIACSSLWVSLLAYSAAATGPRRFASHASQRRPRAPRRPGACVPGPGGSPGLSPTPMSERNSLGALSACPFANRRLVAAGASSALKSDCCASGASSSTGTSSGAGRVSLGSTTSLVIERLGFVAAGSGKTTRAETPG